MLNLKIKRLIEFLLLLRVEPYLFLFMFFFSIKRVPLDQLIQDKICLQKYNLEEHYCSILPQMKGEDDYLQKKSPILGDVAEFTLYSTLVTTIPSVIASMFIGSWIDKYINGKKALMIAGAVSGIFESSIIIWNAYYFDKPVGYILLSYAPSALSGGMIGTFTAIWAYISTTTPPKMRAMRMTIAELCIFVAQPMGTYVGGKVLNTSPIFKNGQLRNYSSVFIIGGVAHVIALLWSIFLINERRDTLQFNLRFNRKTDIEMNRINTVAKSEDKNQNQVMDHKNENPLKLLFSLSNVKDMFKTCLKKRDNYVRLQIWLLFLSMACYLLSHIGPIIFLYQFAQKVYSWNSEKYSNISALGNVVSALATLTIAPILIKVIKAKDTTLSMIGLGAYYIQSMFRALLLSETGFYISIVAGAIGSVASIGIRSHCSKIVEHKELGKVFSLMSTVDSVVPLLASTIFTTVFRATMDTMPGLSFIITGGLLIIPILVMIWIDIYTKIPNFSNKKLKDERNNEVIVDKTRV